MRISDWSSDVCSSDLRTVRATYWGMISEVDRQIGRLVERLKAAGAWDSTVIALTSDHGEMMGDHWTLGKFGYFDQAYHVPLILRDPRHRAGFGGRVAAFTEAVDRKSVVWGKSVSVRVDLGGRRIIKKKKTNRNA